MEKFIKLIIDIKNNYLNHNNQLKIVFKKSFINILSVLKKYLLIKDFVIENGYIIIYLNYLNNNNPVVNGIKLVTKSSFPKYVKVNYLKKILYNDSKNIYFVSTSKGILLARDCIKKKIGGKLLFFVW